jgi:hypothetical protein
MNPGLFRRDLEARPGVEEGGAVGGEVPAAGPSQESPTPPGRFRVIGAETRSA